MTSLSKDELQRYSRHIILPDIGLQGQQRLKEASVLVVGAGGLGVPVLLYLTAAGVGRIGIVDFDKIEISNLQRQVIYETASTGASKAEKARDFIHNQNPNVKVEVYNTWIDSTNALAIVDSFDIIIDGTDNFPTRYLLNDTAVLMDIPYVYGSIYRFEGQVSVFNYQNGPHYRDLFPQPPHPDLVPNCSEGGVLGVLPGIVGSMQALEAIKIITGIGEVLSGRLLTIDTLNNQYRTFKFGKRKDLKPIEKLIDYDQFCSLKESQQELKSVLPSEVASWIKDNKVFQLVDVREPYEYEIVNIGGQLIPKSEIDQHIDQISREIPVVIHCRTGKRSADVIKQLEKVHQYTNLYNLEGGILKWREDVDQSLVTY